MSYDVIARKWRPRTFEDVIGQDPIIRTLTNAIRSDRIHHSFIFAGLRGTGKTSTARIFAKALNCKTGPTDTPCLECVACDEISRGVDVDVFEIDAASNKGVDDIRDLKEIVRFTPTRDRYKVFIIDEAHMLSGHAFNALLKTIEEPPSYVIFILATTEVHKIPATIRSRCQLFEFRRIPDGQIEAQLAKIAEDEKVKIQAAALKLVVEAAEGSMRDGESLLDQIISFSGDEITEDDVSFVLGIANSRVHFELLKAIQENNAESIIDTLDELDGKNTDFVKFLARFGDFMQNTLHALIRQEDDYFPDWMESTDVSTEDLVRHLNTLIQNEGTVKQAFNARIALELILMKMVFSAHVVPVAQLLAKKKSLKTESPLKRTPAQSPKRSANQSPEKDALKRNTQSVPSHAEPADGEREEDAPDVSPGEVFADTCSSFPHLNPFLSKADYTYSDDRFMITFAHQVPNIIREELEAEFKDQLGRRLGRQTGNRITVAFEFKAVNEPTSEVDQFKEHPLVKQVLEAFDGEIEAITDKEK